MSMAEPDDFASAPEFQLNDTNGNLVRLSDYRGKTVVLVLLRGFL